MVNKDTDTATKNRKISSTIVSLLAYTDQTELPLFVWIFCTLDLGHYHQ